MAATIFPAAIAAISLGIVSQRGFDIRIGRNEVFNHAGNVVAALIAGIVGYMLGPAWIFYLVSILAGASIVSVLFIKAGDIDYLQARAAMPQAAHHRVIASSVTSVMTDRKMLAFSVAVTLFHFSNAAMLPLAGEVLTRRNETFASLNMAACVVAAQAVMVPVAFLSGKFAHSW